VAGGENGTRQERAARTRERILDAAAEVFDRQGYAAAPLSAIITLAGVAKGALYFHFASKEELASAIIDEQFRGAPGDDAYATGVQGLVDLTYQVAGQLLDDVRVRAGIRLVIENASFSQPRPDPYLRWIAIVRGFLVAAERAGELRPSVSPDDAAVFVVASFTGIQLVSEVLTSRTDLLTRIAVLWDVLGPWLVPLGRHAELRWTAPA